MPKLNFLDFVGRSVPKDRVKGMCELIGLGKLETKLVLERFCSGIENKTIEQCDFIPVDQQKTLLPHLIRRIRAWIQHNTGYFVLEELEGLTLYNLISGADKTLIKSLRKYFKDEEEYE